MPVPVDLSKLSDIVKNEVLKKTVYDELVEKVNNIDPTGLVLKTKYDADKSDLEKKTSDAEKKIIDTNNFVKKQNSMLKLVKLKLKYLILLV